MVLSFCGISPGIPQGEVLDVGAPSSPSYGWPCPYTYKLMLSRDYPTVRPDAENKEPVWDNDEERQHRESKSKGHTQCSLLSAAVLPHIQSAYFGAPRCIIEAFSSWKRSPTRSEPFICLSMQRMTQPSSRELIDLEEKSVMQSSKQRWTKFW
jgi:hypothetical protein